MLIKRPTSLFEPPTPLYHLLSRPLHFLVYYAHHLISVLRGRPYPASSSPSSSFSSSSSTSTSTSSVVRVVCLSDTHTHTLAASAVPAGDVLVHAGDMGVAGTRAEIQAQVDWLATLPHPHKVVVCGNHDGFLDPRSRKVLGEERKGSIDWKGITYLQHSAATITVQVGGGGGGGSAGGQEWRQRPGTAASSSSSSTSTSASALATTPLLQQQQQQRPTTTATTTRTIKFYGAPQIPACGGADNAFQYERGRDAWTETVPGDTEVLVTHTPARWQQDLPWGQGCEWLLREVRRVRPTLHVCGHVHGGRGSRHVYWDEAELAYEAVCERAQGWRALVRPTVWLDVARVLVYGAVGVLWRRLYGGSTDGTTVVNAALVDWKGKTIVNDPIVVDI